MQRATRVGWSAGSTGGDPTAEPDGQGLVYGLHALFAELDSQHVPVGWVLDGTGATLAQFDEPQVMITLVQRLAIYRNAYRLAPQKDIGLLAGRRQRVSDYGIFGYALASSRTMGDALDLNFTHLRQAGPVLEITSRFEGDLRIYQSHRPQTLGPLLPFVAEFWRSSTQTLFSRVLEADFPSVRMLMPYKAPPHWRSYQQMFRCPVEFDAGVMEWHMDTKFDGLQLPNASAATSLVCRRLCEQILPERSGGSNLRKSLQDALVRQPGHFADVDEVAGALAMSRRTLHRRLAAEGLAFQTIADEMRRVWRSSIYSRRQCRSSKSLPASAFQTCRTSGRRSGAGPE